MLITRTPVLAQQEAPKGQGMASPSSSVTLTSAQLFAFADKARDADALYAAKPIGGSPAVGIAPDTNINHATRSDTLGTIIGNFALNQNAEAKSGEVGVRAAF